MRAHPFLTIVLGCLALGALAPTHAADMQPLPDEAAPQSPIPAPPGSAFSSRETRLPGGRVTEIEVRTGGSHYYLQQQKPAGSANEDAGRTVQWNILNFDTRRPTSPAAPVPPPPRAD